MGEPAVPQYIFTVRHGARLDAADSNWHFTSATPYDPPLTYGGWLQARSLGQRIGNVLSTRSASPASSSLNLTEPKSKGADVKRKQSRIVIHTSPFLRCIQTSIAISAGLSMHWAQQQQQQDGDTDGVTLKQEYIKPLLRVDAWLGEWLTPDYFTEVSPPPEMALLSATSKADLMRPSSAHAIRPNGGSTNSTQTSQSPLNTFSKDLASSLVAEASVGYTPPVPGLAIAPNKPIPRGYVSHAKEYIDIDYPWDSTKFGRGGEYGEEWSSMHKRFRRGYKQMIHWFSTTAADVTASTTVWGKPVCPKAEPIKGKKCSNGISSSEQTADDNANPQQEAEQEDEFETVVILVTHGAGCNALIGAMTDKPVLMDIGIASMTMAERTDKSLRAVPPKPPVKTTYSAGIIPPPTHCPIESSELNVTYDVKVMASTEHLRRGSMAALMNSAGGNSPKLVGRDSPSLNGLRSRPMSGTGGGSAFGGWSLVSGTGGLGSPLLPLNESGLEDTSRYPVLPRRSSVASTVSSTGLWSRPVTAAGGTAGDVSPSTSEGGLSRSNSGKVFIDKERAYRVREQKERSASVRLMPSTTDSDEGEQAAGSEESDSGKDDGTWIERKRRWTMDQANRRAPM